LERHTFKTVWLKDHTQRNNIAFARLMSFHNCLLVVLCITVRGGCELWLAMSPSIGGSRSQPLARDIHGELYQRFCNIVRGVETQRQWSDLAIARTTPVLFGLFSLVTLMADRLIKGKVKPVRTAAWYAKQRPTFSDVIAIVRRCLWSGCHFSTSTPNSDVVKVSRSLWERLTDTVCYAA
jgi:hypothetical protein